MTRLVAPTILTCFTDYKVELKLIDFDQARRHNTMFIITYNEITMPKHTHDKLLLCSLKSQFILLIDKYHGSVYSS